MFPTKPQADPIPQPDLLPQKEASLRAQRSNLVPVTLSPSRLLRRSARRNDKQNLISQVLEQDTTETSENSGPSRCYLSAEPRAGQDFRGGQVFVPLIICGRNSKNSGNNRRRT